MDSVKFTTHRAASLPLVLMHVACITILSLSMDRYRWDILCGNGGGISVKDPYMHIVVPWGTILPNFLVHCYMYDGDGWLRLILNKGGSCTRWKYVPARGYPTRSETFENEPVTIEIYRHMALLRDDRGREFVRSH